LHSFKILKVEEIAGEIIFKWEKNFYATSYEVVVYDEEDNVLADKKMILMKVLLKI
jgi:hypothetical protein